jgi:hypothetical protein
MTRLKYLKISAQKLRELFGIDTETFHRWNKEGLKNTKINRKSYSLKRAFNWYKENKVIPVTDFDFDALSKEISRQLAELPDLSHLLND